MAELSILIPARNEQYLQKTVDDLLNKIEGDTEILVGMDGESDYGFSYSDTPRLSVFFKKEIGQRAMQNYLASQSKAKYVMKIDGHCLFSQGFDVEMMQAMDDKTIMSPFMLRLDAEKWQPLPQNPTSTYVFDTNLVMQHWREGDTDNAISETMVPVGAAFMVTRENYWKWNLCDESLGSWGGQCTELGIKAYLNGGHCVTNKNCYFAHLFREKKTDFPYDRGEHPGLFALEELRKRYKNKSIAGLIEKFNYPADWSKQAVSELK